nr:copia protein [Tanacetum cinerariifolium]
MSVAPPVPLRPHSPSKGLKRPKKTCFVCKSETHLIKDGDFHAKKMAQNSYASRDIHKHYAQMTHSRIPLHKVSAAARTVGAARPTFSKTCPHIAPYTVLNSKAPIRRPFIRRTSPKPRVSPPRVNAANPSTVSAARVNTANASAVSAARVKAAKLFAVSAARINAVTPSAVTAVQYNPTKKGDPQQALKDKGVIDSGCSRHMTGNISYSSDFEELNGGYVAFGGNPKGGKITGKVSQMCDKKNNVLFTDTECLILSSDFKLPDMNLTYGTINKLVKGNLVRGLPSKVFTNDLTCVACKKGKQHRASFLAENQSNPTAGFQDTAKEGEEGTQTYVLFLVLSDGSTNPKNNKDAHTGGNKYNDDIQKSVSPEIHSSSCGDQAREQGDKAVNKDKGKSPAVTITGFKDLNKEFAECINNSSNGVSATGPSVSATGLDFTNSTNDFTAADLSHDADDVGAEADTNNMKSIILVSPIPTTRIHKDHPTSQIIGDMSSTTQTRSMARGRAIGTKWVYRNKKDERGIVIRNKARLVAQGHTQEEGINYEEVFAPVARIESIRLFLAYASFMGFLVYQMDIKSAFLYGTIEEEVYVCQPPEFEDPEYPDKTKCSRH